MSKFTWVGGWKINKYYISDFTTSKTKSTREDNSCYRRQGNQNGGVAISMYSSEYFSDKCARKYGYRPRGSSIVGHMAIQPVK